MGRLIEMLPEDISIFISAGDPSGDIAGFHLLKQLQKKDNRIKFFGLGGRRMLNLGQRQLVESRLLAVLGFWEVAKKFFFFRKLMNDTVEEIKKTRPRAIVLIDYPGFNLRLAKRIRSLGFPIIYYISPQIWAWGGKRIHLIKKVVDLMLLILPFEQELYDRVGVANKFVGHYLFDDMENQYIKAPYNKDSDLIVLMPGSRPQEVQRMLPTLLKTVDLLAQASRWRFAVAAVEGDIDYKYYLAGCTTPVEIIKGKTRELITQSRLVITSSGTATLETGIIGRPMIVLYKTGWLTYNIAKHLVKLKSIALINIAAGEEIVPELIQNDATPQKITSIAEKFLGDNELSEKTVQQLNQVTDNLGQPGCSSKSADAVWELINC